MRFRVFAVALSATALAGFMSLAQDFRGPAELPPSSFRGQQFTDSRGCVFLRAGVGGATNWVPRISRNRRQLCGYPPTFARVEIPTVETAEAAPPAAAAPAREPAAAAAAAPPRVVRKPRPDPAPTVVSRPVETAEAEAAPAAPAPRVVVRRTKPRPPPAPTVVSAPPEEETAPAPAKAPRTVVRRVYAASAPPAPTVVSGPASAEAEAPAPVRRVAATATPGCPSHAPYGARVATTSGRTTLLCVGNPDQIPAYALRTTEAPRYSPAPAVAPPAPAVARAAPAPATYVAAAPAAPAGTRPRHTEDGRIACPASAPTLKRFALQGGGSTLLCTGRRGEVAAAVGPSGAAFAPVIPRGYRAAWEDDRLNPLRGVGTLEGQVAQDQIWTRETPARLVTEVEAKKAKKKTKRVVVVSTSGAPVKAPAAAKAAARLFVQVGAFGEPANADRARARLKAAGLPVAEGKGKGLRVIYAGPFASQAEAQSAVAIARRAGFGDAFIR